MKLREERGKITKEKKKTLKAYRNSYNNTTSIIKNILMK